MPHGGSQCLERGLTGRQAPEPFARCRGNSAPPPPFPLLRRCSVGDQRCSTAVMTAAPPLFGALGHLKVAEFQRRDATEAVMFHVKQRRRPSRAAACCPYRNQSAASVESPPGKGSPVASSMAPLTWLTFAPFTRMVSVPPSSVISTSLPTWVSTQLV